MHRSSAVRGPRRVGDPPLPRGTRWGIRLRGQTGRVTFDLDAYVERARRGPKRHVEGVVQDLDLPEYLHLQEVVHRVGRAVSRAVPTERLYVLSLGSQDGNAHVHWHVAPLPPGVPYERQQFHALMAENGVLDVSDAEQAALAEQLRRRL